MMIMRMMMISCHLLFISCILHSSLHHGLEPNLNNNNNNHHHHHDHHHHPQVFSVTTTTVEDIILLTNQNAEIAPTDGIIQCTSQSLVAISILHYLHLAAIERGPIDTTTTTTASSSKARESSAFDPELRFQHISSLPVNVSTAADHQNESQTVADRAVENAKSLFGSFAWKGIGLCVRKSVINWNACGVSIRLPVTGNFPEYDNIVYYPRMTCFVGVAYPYSVYLTLSLSLPSQTAMLPLQLLLSNGTARGSSSSSIRSLISRTTTDSVRRYGLSWSLKYDQQRGSHFSVGPTCSYVPGSKFVAIITHYVSYLFAQSQLLLRQWTTRLSTYIGKVLNTTTTTMSNAAAVRAVFMLYRSSIDYIRQVIRRLLRWLERKSPLLACNLGVFASKPSSCFVFGVSSNLILELQPFFFFRPLHKEVTRLLKKAYERCCYHSSTAQVTAVSTQRNRLNQNETAGMMMPAPMIPVSCA